MRADSQDSAVILGQRIRHILDTILEPDVTGSRSPAEEFEDAIVEAVLSELGDPSTHWQSHELIEKIYLVCRRHGHQQHLSAIDDLICWPSRDVDQHDTVKLIADRMAQFSGPTEFEFAIANSYLSMLWPVHDGLNPSAPFQFLSRRIETESLCGRDTAFQHIGDAVIREIPWVSDTLVIGGALDRLAGVSCADLDQRWDLLQARLGGYLETLGKAPKLLWEVPALPTAAAGCLFAEEADLEQHRRFLLRCSEQSTTTTLQIRVPLPVPASTRALLGRCLQGSHPPEICWQGSRSSSIVAGHLYSDPSGLKTMVHRMRAFDHIAEHGEFIPWASDWIAARERSEPLWLASERTQLNEAVEYLKRSSSSTLSIPVIGIDSSAREKAAKLLKKMIRKISRRRGGGWDRLEELLQDVAISPRLLASTVDRA